MMHEKENLPALQVGQSAGEPIEAVLVDRTMRGTLDRSHRAGLPWVHGPIRPTPGVSTPADTAQGAKRLFSGKKQAILPSDRRHLGNVGSKAVLLSHVCHAI